MSTNIIVAVLLNREMDTLSGKVAGALVVYHVGPVVRAISRIRRGDLGGGGGGSGGLGGPWLYALVHILCAACLSASFLSSNF